MLTIVHQVNKIANTLLLGVFNVSAFLQCAIIMDIRCHKFGVSLFMELWSLAYNLTNYFFNFDLSAGSQKLQTIRSSGSPAWQSAFTCLSTRMRLSWYVLEYMSCIILYIHIHCTAFDNDLTVNKFWDGNTVQTISLLMLIKSMTHI